MPSMQLDCNKVQLAMYSDFCDPRIQVEAHWILESVRVRQAYLWGSGMFLTRSAHALSSKFALLTAK
jgi:hypothetical protein